MGPESFLEKAENDLLMETWKVCSLTFSVLFLCIHHLTFFIFLFAAGRSYRKCLALLLLHSQTFSEVLFFFYTSLGICLQDWARVMT